MMQSDLQPIARKQATAINRTSVELKLGFITASFSTGVTINRTSVELKLG